MATLLIVLVVTVGALNDEDEIAGVEVFGPDEDGDAGGDDGEGTVSVTVLVVPDSVRSFVVVTIVIEATGVGEDVGGRGGLVFVLLCRLLSRWDRCRCKMLLLPSYRTLCLMKVWRRVGLELGKGKRTGNRWCRGKLFRLLVGQLLGDSLLWWGRMRLWCRLLQCRLLRGLGRVWLVLKV